jgi:poly[(R)-3-hydroxyalkanoate] polymerase subunit PhaC
MRVKVDPSDAAKEFGEFTRRMQAGRDLLDRTKDKDVQIATTPKREVWRQDKTVLYHYTPTAKTTVKTPVLMVYGLIGRYTMADLQEDRSLVRNLLAQGVDLYVVDWGTPTRSDRWLTLEDYVDGYLGECVDFIRKQQGSESVSLLGICEGGVFTTCYAARNPAKVKNLVLTITPIDFHAGAKDAPLHHGMIGLWARSMSREDVDRLIEANGNLPGELMSLVFSMMTPVNSLTKYNLGLFDVMDDEKKLLNFLRMEKWLADRPDHPGEAAKQWLKDLYQDNQLVKGEFKLAGRKVDLKKVTMPVLNIFAQEDHIIPPKSSQALKSRIGTKDYTELPLPGGHVGVFVSGKSQGILGKNIYGWLKAHA